MFLSLIGIGGGVPLDSHELLILLSSFGSADFWGLKKMAVSEETLGFPIENPTPNLFVFHLLLWLPLLRFLLGQVFPLSSQVFEYSTNRGHYMKPTQTMHGYKGNPSKLPSICIVWFSHKMCNLMTPGQARFAWNKGSSFPQLHFGARDPCEVAMQFVPEYVPKP